MVARVEPPANGVAKELERWHRSYAGHVVVTMPPTWRGGGGAAYTYVFAAEPVDRDAYERFYRGVVELGLPRPRLVCSDVLELASLFHPLFYAGAVRGSATGADDSLARHLAHAAGARTRRSASPPLRVASAAYWLQSMLFLAGVTLSAAIVQSRWSLGTLESKLDRLWQAAAVARAIGHPGLAPLALDELVLALAPRLEAPDVRLILELKLAYAAALARVVDGIPAEQRTMRPSRLPAAYRARFGFVENLGELLGRNLRSVVAYGSSVNSDRFADYDLILVAASPAAALERLAGRRPTYRGKELNLSVFGEEDFWTYQLASGDNLTHHGVVLLGEVTVPEKTSDDLLLRNFSFGFVRLRQLLGMAAAAAAVPLETPADDKRNLYGYFAKIPLNVAKGVLGAAGEPISKEAVVAWTQRAVGYAVEGEPGAGAIAGAAWATAAVLRAANAAYDVYEQVPQPEAQLWGDLESWSAPLEETAE